MYLRNLNIEDDKQKEWDSVVNNMAIGWGCFAAFGSILAACKHRYTNREDLYTLYALLYTITIGLLEYYVSTHCYSKNPPEDIDGGEFLLFASSLAPTLILALSCASPAVASFFANNTCDNSRENTGFDNNDNYNLLVEDDDTLSLGSIDESTVVTVQSSNNLLLFNDIQKNMGDLLTVQSNTNNKNIPSSRNKVSPS